MPFLPVIAEFLLAICGSLAAKVLLSIGLGYVTYQAIMPLLDDVVSKAKANYQGMPSTVLDLLNMAGAGDAFGIIVAAMVTRGTLIATKKLMPK